MLLPAFPFSHTQAVESDTWTISHNMGCIPAVAVQVLLEGTMQTIIPKSITYPNANTVVVSFSKAFSGTARLS